MTKKEIKALLEKHRRINCVENQPPRQYFEGIIQAVFDAVADILETKTMTEREARLVLADCINQYDPPDPGKECGAGKFLRSEEPLNEFYTGVIAAMYEAHRLAQVNREAR